MSNYPIDAAKFLLYLRTVQPESTKFVFQTFTDSKQVTKALKAQKQRDPLACTFTATPEEALTRLQVLQDKGAGIFVQMNVSTSRGKDNVTKLSSYFLDTDGAPIGPIVKAMPKPLMIVSSSKGNFHIYWRTADPLQSFRATQKSLALSFECDEAMVNLDRVVRIPGTWHLKNLDNPFQVDLTIGEDKVYKANELLSRAPQATPKQSASKPMSMIEAMIVTGEGFEMPTVLPAGNRTHLLVSYAGKLVNEGFGAEFIKQKVKETMLKLLPKGEEPIPDETLEIEVYPAIYSFIERDNRAVEAEPEMIPAPPADDDLPAPPADGWASVEEAGTGLDLELLEEFIYEFRFIEKDSRIARIKNDMINYVYKMDEFKNAFANRKRGKTQLTKAFIECVERKTVRDVIYYPGKPVEYVYRGENVLNNYTPPEIKLIDEPHPAQIQTFLDHIDYMFPDQVDAHTFLCWMAVTIREPERRVPWAPFIVSTPGVGKGWLAELMKVLVGPQNHAMIGPEDLKSGFNEFMFEKTLLVIDELKTTGRDQFDIVEKLKPMITESDIAVNIKFGVKGTYPTYVNILCFSNHSNALPIDESDRRFWIHQVEALARDKTYYNELFHWLTKTDGPYHVHAWLMKYDLADFVPTATPAMTKAKREMVEAFRTEVEIILHDAIEDRVGPFVSSVLPRDIVEVFVADRLGMDNLGRAEKAQIKAFRMRYCAEINGSDKRLRVDYGTDTKTRKYPVIVRDFAQWVDAPKQKIIDEMARAWRASLGQNPGANLETVEINEELNE